MNIFDDNGSVKETFNFPLTTPIVIEDPSDTETEDEEENDNEKEKDAKGEEEPEEKAEEREEAEQEKEAVEEEEEEETTTPEEATAAEACVVTRQRTQITASAWNVVPTPQRAVRLDSNHSSTKPLQPVPSIAESESIEARLLEELPDLTDDDIQFMMSDTPF